MTRDRLFVQDMRDAVAAVLEYTEGGREEFLEDRRTRDAVVRNLEVLGEASKRVSPATRDRAPHLPWKEMAGMRDKLIHDYGRVDVHMLWTVIEHHLPGLQDELETLLRGMP